MLFCRPGMIRFLDLPRVSQAFYARILGAVLLGVGIALLVEWFRKEHGPAGLGLREPWRSMSAGESLWPRGLSRAVPISRCAGT